jgi:glutaconate CoA-transferase, subunit B
MDSPPNYTIDELLMTTMSREVKEGVLTAVGTLSPIPAAACILASLTTAKHARLIILGDPKSPLDRGSSQLFDMAQRGLVDLFFLSFVQMDADCNLNLTVIGNHEKPRIRFPGGAGSSMLYHMVKRIVLFKMSHTKKDFVPKVDFITCSGLGVDLNEFQRPGGPDRMITNLAVLKVNRGQKKIRLESVHLGISIQQVIENTGFEIEVPPDVPETTCPTVGELELLRTVVKERLSQIYPEYSKKVGLQGHISVI